MTVRPTVLALLAALLLVPLSSAATASTTYDPLGEWQLSGTCSCGFPVSGTASITQMDSASGSFSGTATIYSLTGPLSGSITGNQETISATVFYQGATTYFNEVGTIAPDGNSMSGSWTTSGAVSWTGTLTATRILPPPSPPPPQTPPPPSGSGNGSGQTGTGQTGAGQTTGSQTPATGQGPASQSTTSTSLAVVPTRLTELRLAVRANSLVSVKLANANAFTVTGELVITGPTVAQTATYPRNTRARLGVAWFAISPHATKTVSVRLTRQGRTALARRPLSAVITITTRATGRSPVTRTYKVRLGLAQRDRH